VIRRGWKKPRQNSREDVKHAHRNGRKLSPRSSTTTPKLRWQDGRDPDTPITLQEAARDLSTYRKEQKERLLQEVQAQWDQFQGQEQGLTAQPEKTPETEPQQPQESPEEQWAKYVDALPPEGKLQVQAAVEYSQKAQAAEQIADTYTMALTEAVGLLQGQTDRAFADIKTVADAQNLQVRDPARFAILQQRLLGYGKTLTTAELLRFVLATRPPCAKPSSKSFGPQALEV
jgi:hypothetical protein